MEDESSNQVSNGEEVNSIPPSIVPFVGKVFASSDEVYDMYNTYGGFRGFSIRKYGNKILNGVEIWKRFVCSKEGRTKEKVVESTSKNKRNRWIAKRRSQCFARLCITLQEDGSWMVTYYEDNHNHELQPLKRHHFRSQRKVSKAKRVMMKNFDDANIPTCKQVRIFESQVGGRIESIGCTTKDIENSKRDERKLVEGHDAEMLLIHFKSEKEKNPSFYYIFRQDDEGKFDCCFWTDAKGRRAYHYFGDCIVMDATYKTNKYHMIFVAIAGVNHHRQTIVFGSALISSEKTESYMWLLSNFLSAMPSRSPPTVIITDQDAALGNVIKDLLPSTFHRYYVWHILYKFDKKLPHKVLKEHYHKFQANIQNSETCEDFDTSWKQAIKESGMEEDEWLSNLFEIREKWAPPYCSHVFSAGMSASQRAESSHSFFKKFVEERNTLLDFITKFEMALRHQRENEVKSDFDDVDQEQRLITLYPIEKEMSIVYTKKNFKIFQNELFQSQHYLKLNIVSESENEVEYNVLMANRIANPGRILLSQSTNFVKCSCRMFDFEGIPCRHLLFFYRARQEESLPSEFVLERWIRNAKSKEVWDEGIEIKEYMDSELMARHMWLSQMSQNLNEAACLSREATNYAWEGMQVLLQGVKFMMEIDEQVKEAQSTTSKVHEESISIKDPEKVRTKGCGTGGRIKSKKEVIQANKKQHTCRICEEKGHNMRTCTQRWGTTAHIVFLAFCFLTNIIVTAMLLLGGSAVVNALTGVNIYVASFLIPLGVIVYTLAGGLKATFLANYIHSVIVHVVFSDFRLLSLHDKQRAW